MVLINLSAPVFDTYRDDLRVSLYLFRGREGMDSTEFRPRQRNHTACAVEFHRAAAERGHGMN